MSVSLRTMRYFNTAVSFGSISRAADDLNIAASAVSAAIDQVEAHFQLKLVNRFRSRGITATTSGKTMQRKFANLLDEYEAMMIAGAELGQTLKGELRIGYYAPVAPAFLPRILMSLADGGTKPMFHLEECDNDRAQQGLLAGEFDVILFVSDAAVPQVEFDVLIEAPAYCLVAKGHSFAHRSSVSLSDFEGQPMIVLNRPMAVDYYQQLFNFAETQPATIAYANSTEMVRSLVGAGHGIAALNMVPETSTSYAGDGLVAIPIDDTLSTLKLSIGYGKSNPRRIVRQFVDLCRSYFETDQGRNLIISS